MFMPLGMGDDTVTVSSDPLAAFNAAQTADNNSYTSGGAPGLPLCSSMTTSPGFVGPINCDPSQGPVTYTVNAIQSQASAQAAAAAACSQGGGTFDTTTGSCNKGMTTTYLMLAFAALAAIAFASGGHR